MVGERKRGRGGVVGWVLETDGGSSEGEMIFISTQNHSLNYSLREGEGWGEILHIAPASVVYIFWGWD